VETEEEHAAAEARAAGVKASGKKKECMSSVCLSLFICFPAQYDLFKKIH